MPLDGATANDPTALPALPRPAGRSGGGTDPPEAGRAEPAEAGHADPGAGAPSQSTQSAERSEAARPRPGRGRRGPDPAIRPRPGDRPRPGAGQAGGGPDGVPAPGPRSAHPGAVPFPRD